MTEQENKILHAFVEPEGFNKSRCPVCGWPLKQTIDEGCTSESCSMRPGPERRADAIPDYTSQPHFDYFLRVLFSDAMYEAFEYHAGNAWAATGTKRFLIPWLFSDHARFLRLFLDWLGLEETQREFGYSKCKTTSKVECHDCAECDGNGNIPRPWLRVLKKGKE